MLKIILNYKCRSALMVTVPIWLVWNMSTGLQAQNTSGGTAGTVVSTKTGTKPSPFDKGWYVNPKVSFAITNFHLIKTSDGGRSWIMLTPMGSERSLSEIYDLSFASALRGWLLVRGSIWQSEDGASQWTLLVQGGKIPVMASSTHGWMEGRLSSGGPSPVDLVTDNSGKTWKSCAGAAGDVPNGGINHVSFVSSNEAYGIGLNELNPGYRFELAHTVDGGCTWRRLWTLPDEWDESLDALFFLNGREGWLGGEGTIYHSIDGGLHWDRLDVKKGIRVISIYFSSRMQGWLLASDFGSGGGIFRTMNGGHTWARAFPQSYENTSVSKIPKTVPEAWNRGKLAQIIYQSNP